MPYAGFALTARVNDAGSPSSLHVAASIPSIKHRQIIVSSIIESKTHLPYTFPVAASSSFLSQAVNFPRQHYVIRPTRWSINEAENFDSGGGSVNDDYKTDYPLENTIWGRGGFRFRQPINWDYSKTNNYDIQFAVPKVGYKEKTDFCSRVWWSRKRNINVQDDPNLKTFLDLNHFDISDAHGEIKYLYDNDSEKGNNLFAITENGVCLLITDKRTISDMDSKELFVLDADRFVKGQYWLDKIAGCTGEMWRGIAEYGNMLFYPSAESVYMLNGLQITDILRNNEGTYYERLHPELQKISNDKPMAGVYNIDNKEYWLYLGDKRVFADEPDIIDELDDFIGISAKRLSFGGYYEAIISDRLIKGLIGDDHPEIPLPPSTIIEEIISSRDNRKKDYVGSTFVYKADINAFTGSFAYKGEKFICVQGLPNSKNLKVKLLKNYETYDTNKGNTIDGSPVLGKLLYVVSTEGHLHKEFIDMTFNSSLKPNKIQLSNTANSVEATQQKFKNYNGWYTMTPRKQQTRVRFQSRALLVEVFNDDTGEFEISTVETGYKIIK